MRAHGQTGWRLGVKAFFDRTIAFLGLVFLSPIFLVVSLLILVSMGRPIYFRQRRPGRHARPFTLLKFRTMTSERDGSGALLPDAGRLTSIGRIIRATSLDEIPQLLNVLGGNLSLVGPRPLLMDYLPRYTPFQARRHEVMPGITGWAQVNGRNAIGWDQKFELDVWYVDHWNLLLDLKILFRTVYAVIKRTGISSMDHATMAEYMGPGHRNEIHENPATTDRMHA